MKKLFKLLPTVCLICALAQSLILACDARAGDAKTSAIDVFTPPTELGHDTPSYVDASGKPLKHYLPSGEDGSQPAFEEVIKLPSLSQDQRTLIRRIQSDAQLQAQSLQKDIKSLQATLADRKKLPAPGDGREALQNGVPILPLQYQSPGEMQSISGQAPMQSADAEMQIPVTDDLLKSKIQNSTEQIKMANAKSWQAALSLLSDKQKIEFDQMRAGKVTISESASSAPLDSADPNLKPASQAGHNGANQNGKTPTGAGAIGRLENTVIDVTKQAIPRVLNGF